jgi:hypothetical protein
MEMGDPVRCAVPRRSARGRARRPSAARRGAARRRSAERDVAGRCTAGRCTAGKGAVAALAVFLWAPAALAFTPADALAATPEGERTVRQAAAVDAAERALGASRTGTDVTFTARPVLSYGADIEDPAAIGAAADVELDLAWLHDPAAILADRADLLQARERLRHDRRSDVLAALRLHGKVLAAEVALQRAELDLARTQRSAASPTSNPALRRAQVLVEARRHALEALQAQAARLGFEGAARFVPLRFALPRPATRAPQRERLQLELQRALVQRDSVPFDVVRDVTLAATYESSSYDYQVSASLSLDRGRPAADLDGQLGAQEDDQWSVALSARLRLDGSTEDAQAAADEGVRRARAALDALDASYPDDVGRARTAVDDATALLDAELGAWRDAGAAGASPSACRVLLARENAVYRAWLDVVTAAYDYLELVDGDWLAEGTWRSSAEATARDWPVRPSACADATVGGGGPGADRFGIVA